MENIKPEKTPLTNLELDQILRGVLSRLTIENGRLTDIIASELLKHTGILTPDRLLEVREHLLRRVGIEDMSKF